MTTISAKIVADSIMGGARITTLELVYPRIIHSEFMTHRVFSRNASSSRAIPYERSRDAILADPYVPISWGKNQKGMQASEEQIDAEKAKEYWLDGLEAVVCYADQLHKLGLHKQHINRLLEPWSHIRVVVTATSDVFPHFFDLRDHPDAQPEIQQLARAIRVALDGSIPAYSDYHLPYVSMLELASLTIQDLMMVSSARCARVSYRTHDGMEPRLDEDLLLGKRLLASKHLSPFEHPAQAAEFSDRRYANLVGWQSYRNKLGY